MKSICFVNSVKFWGGGEKLHLDYAIALSSSYKISFICSPNSELSKKVCALNLSLEKIFISKLSFLNPFKIIRFVHYFRENNIDTVIFSISKDAKCAGIAAKIAGVKKIVYLRGLAVPIKNSYFNRLVYGKICTHIVANSEATKKMILLNLHHHIAKDKVKVIYHGIEFKEKQSHLKNILPKEAQGIILANAGRLSKQKGQQLLIQVAAKLKERKLNFSLTIAGIGELEQELKQNIQAFQLQDHVFLLGFVEDMETFMSSIDIFILSSLWEGFGYVIVEAMSKEVPVIAFDRSSNSELIINDQTGYLVKDLDLEEFANKIQCLIENESLRKEMGNHAKQSFLERFQLQDRIKEFENYLLSH